MERKHVPFVPLSIRGYRGFVREDFRSVFTDDFLVDIEAAVVGQGGRIVKDSRVRWAAIYPCPGRQGLFIK